MKGKLSEELLRFCKFLAPHFILSCFSSFFPSAKALISGMMLKDRSLQEKIYVRFTKFGS